MTSQHLVQTKTASGIRYEPDSRHAEIVAKQLKMHDKGVSPVGTPGVKEDLGSRRNTIGCRNELTVSLIDDEDQLPCTGPCRRAVRRQGIGEIDGNTNDGELE